MVTWFPITAATASAKRSSADRLALKGSDVPGGPSPPGAVPQYVVVVLLEPIAKITTTT